MTDNRGTIFGGVILIMLGLGFLAMQIFEGGGGFVPLAIGVAFLIAHFLYRVYGYLVPGGIVTGLGLGILAEELGLLASGAVPLGLGVGFLLVWVIDRLVTRAGPAKGSWWPLIPGAVLVFASFGALFPETSLIVLRYAWAIALIAAGIAIIVRGVRSGGGRGPQG